MSKPWGGIGAWAAEAERAEAEEQEQAAAAIETAAANTAAESERLPSQKGANKMKPKKMSLFEFRMGDYMQQDPSMESKGLMQDEMIQLPTGPKQRSIEEMQHSQLGGGFQSYRLSGAPQGQMRDRDGDINHSWGGNRVLYGGFDGDCRVQSPRALDFNQPSRADQVDKWATTKKYFPSPSIDSGRHAWYNRLGGGTSGRGSRADEVDNWAIGKKPLPARSSTFSLGFRDSFLEPDHWTRKDFCEDSHEQPRLILNPPSREVISNDLIGCNRPNPFGHARPREEILAEKGVDWKKLDSEIEYKKTSWLMSSYLTRPSSTQSSQSEDPIAHGSDGAVKPRPKVNPFGDAKPREVLLEERGKDWRKMDKELEHRGVERPETEEEKNLREEIWDLKRELQKESEKRQSMQGSGEDQISLQDLILSKERNLEQLNCDLDDKVRFGRKVMEKPGSGAFRGAIISERLPSQSDSLVNSRNKEIRLRPQTPGTGDVRIRPGDNRRAFQGGMERRILGNRDTDRSTSGERW